MQNNKSINIEEIMQEIKTRAAARDYKSIPDFDDLDEELPLDKEYDYSILDGEINQLCMHYELDVDFPLTKSGLKKSVQRVVRKVTRFLLVPLTSQQTMFNTSTVRSVNQLKNYIKVQEELNDNLQNRITQLEADIQTLKGKSNR